MSGLRFSFPVWAALAMLIAGGGCQPEEQIRQYRVARLPDSQPATARGRESSTPQRMLAAVVPRDDRAWFFKITGPDEEVAGLEKPFLEFLHSLQFSPVDGAPTWKLPEGWSRSNAADSSGMRFATINAGSQELTIIPLATSGSREETILKNINRWRGQLGLAAVTQEELADSGVVSFKVNGQPVTAVNLFGRGSGTMSRAPFAGGGLPGGGNRPGPQPGPAAGGATGAKLTYTVPAGWTERPASGMRKAALEVKADGQTAEITVIDLNAAASARLPNVNRWREQIGLKPVTQEQLDASMKTIRMGEVEGDLVELVGPSDADRPETILGVIAEHGGKAWFIKLRGDAELAAKEKKRFEEFSRSIRLP